MCGFWGRRLIVAMASSAVALAGAASATVIEVIDVDVSNPSGVQTTMVLEDGVTYEITVSGVAEIGSGIGISADAEYYSLDNFSTVFDINANRGVDIGLTIDGALVAWGAFNPEHIYTISIVGAGEPLLLAFLDTFYADNVGYLTVTISAYEAEIPIPGAAVLFGTALAAGAFRLRKRKKRSA